MKVNKGESEIVVKPFGEILSVRWTIPLRPDYRLIRLGIREFEQLKNRNQFKGNPQYYCLSSFDLRLFFYPPANEEGEIKVHFFPPAEEI